MKETLLSDWTLVAFKQREEERRRREQLETSATPPQRETPRSTETLRNEWTIAALQQRFAALEQRIATLEHGLEEQRRKERVEAAGVRPGEAMPRREELLLTGSTLVAPDQVGQQAQYAQAKIQHQGVESAGRDAEQRLQRDEVETVRLDAGDRLERRPDETVHVGKARKMASRFILFMITAFTAGAMGFGAAIYAVPVEKAMYFRGLAKRGLESIYGGHTSRIK